MESEPKTTEAEKPPRPTCSTCPYHECGICRFMPPQVVCLAGGPSTEWRMVHEKDWCGEHPRIKAIAMRTYSAAWAAPTKEVLKEYGDQISDRMARLLGK